MSTETYIAKKAASSIANKFKPRLINWFLNKTIPFNHENIVLDLSDIPDIRLDYQHHFYTLSVDFTLRNFDWYELELNTCECRIAIESSGFMTVKESISRILKPGQKMTYRFEKSLTEGEIQRAKKLFGDKDIKTAHFEFYLISNTRFGIRYLNLSKRLCIQLFESK